MRVILITGGSSGIGEATAVRFASRGDWALLLAGRTPSKLAAVTARCRAMTAAPIATVVGDIREEHICREIVDRAATLGELKAVVNSAGLGKFASLTAMPLELVREMLEVNILALLHICQASAPIIANLGGGTIVNVSSDADSLGFSDAVGYCGSKAGVLGASRALQLELRPLRIRVTVVAPGRVDTHFNDKMPGMRPGALDADEVAEVIEFAVTCSENIQITEIRLDSLGRMSAC